MARQEIAIGAPTSASATTGIRWNGVSHLVDAALSESTAYLRDLRVIFETGGTAGALVFRTAHTPAGEQFSSGPEMASAWRDSVRAVILSTASLEIEIPGPTHASNDTSDPSEPYGWTPAASVGVAGWIADFAALSAAEQATTVLTLDNQGVTPPERPNAPSVAVLGETSLRTTGVAPDNGGETISSYDFRYRATGATDWIDILAVTDIQQTVTGLDPSTEYEFQFRARNSAGASDYSPSGTGTTTAPPVAIDTIPAMGGEVVRMLITTETAGASNWYSRFTTPGGALIETGDISADSDNVIVADPTPGETFDDVQLSIDRVQWVGDSNNRLRFNRDPVNTPIQVSFGAWLTGDDDRNILNGLGSTDSTLQATDPGSDLAIYLAFESGTVHEVPFNTAFFNAGIHFFHVRLDGDDVRAAANAVAVDDLINLVIAYRSDFEPVTALEITGSLAGAGGTLSGSLALGTDTALTISGSLAGAGGTLSGSLGLLSDTALTISGSLSWRRRCARWPLGPPVGYPTRHFRRSQRCRRLPRRSIGARHDRPDRACYFRLRGWRRRCADGSARSHQHRRARRARHAHTAARAAVPDHRRGIARRSLDPAVCGLHESANPGPRIDRYRRQEDRRPPPDHGAGHEPGRVRRRPARLARPARRTASSDTCNLQTSVPYLGFGGHRCTPMSACRSTKSPFTYTTQTRH